jgi:hypothetical protein
VLVNMALVCDDVEGFGNLVVRTRRLTLWGMRLMKGLTVVLMVEGELGSSVRKVFWIHRILWVDAAFISLYPVGQGAKRLTCSS